MDRKELDRLGRWFDEYVAGFYRDDPEYDRAIKLKEFHTHRVRDNCGRIAQALDFSESDRALAETVGLFHDIGRFPQYQKYGTFVDRLSEHHGRLSVRVVSVNRALANLTPAERRLVARAVVWHNAAGVPPGLDGRTERFLRLVRDADKLDIWRVFAEYYATRDRAPNSTIELGLSDSDETTPEVLAAIQAGGLVPYERLRTITDIKLLQMSWVFDLNFRAAFRMIRDRGHLERIAETLPQDPVVQAAVQSAFRHVESMLNGGGSAREGRKS